MNQRVVERQKGAFARRTEELKFWQGKLEGDKDNKSYQSKVAIAQEDLANLKKKLGGAAHE